jgi:uncharacterized membrane protein
MSSGHSLQRYFLTGVVTLLPLWLTLWVFDLVFQQLSAIGLPWVDGILDGIAAFAPGAQPLLESVWIKRIVAAALTLIGIIGLGFLTTRVLGKRLLALFDSAMQRIPLVQVIYGSVKKLIDVLSRKPGGGGQRVVLIDFPNPKMRAIGLITRTLTDATTGRELAAVYVPTTPNPTSGYIEIVPMADLIITNWTMDEAMSFIVSGGAIAPATIPFDRPERAS